MQIKDLFESDVTRDIAPVVYFHEQSPDKLADEVAEDRLARLRNAFQNPDRAEQIAREELCVDLFGPIGTKGQQAVGNTFQKRHAITHNLGVVDRKYLEHGGGAGGLGREVPLTAAEVGGTVDLVAQVLSKLYQSLFTP